MYAAGFCAPAARAAARIDDFCSGEAVSIAAVTDVGLLI
jgi:hypothetical protein